MVEAFQLGDRRYRDHLAVRQDRDPVADRVQGIEVVGDQEDGEAQRLLGQDQASKAAAPIGSRPAVGSSRNSSGVQRQGARQPARLRMPPDSCEGSLSSASAGNPASLIFSRRSS